jgi:hypothetical protein
VNDSSATRRIEPPDVHSILDPLFEPVKFVELPACECFKRLRASASEPWGLLPDTLIHFRRLQAVSEAIMRDLGPAEEGTSRSSAPQECAEKASSRRGRYERNTREYLSSIHDERPTMTRRSGHRRAVRSIHAARLWLKKLLDRFLYDEALSPEEFVRRVGVTHLWLSPKAELRVTCPVCGQNSVYLSDELRMYYLLRTLSRTFELQRLRWLHMTSALHFSHAASTHTRYAHGVGTAMTALSAMEHVTILPAHNHAQPLGQYLASRALVDEFFSSNLLHDIGHPPHSHVLEKNPVLEIDHEEATKSLLSGTTVKGPHGSYSWHTWLEYFNAIHTLGNGRASPAEHREHPALLREVLINCGVRPRATTELLEPARFTKSLDTRDAGDVVLLRCLTDSDLDIDRIDHVRRDSVTTGLSLSSLRERELLQGLAVWFELNPLSCERIHVGQCTRPWDGPDGSVEEPGRSAQAPSSRAEALGRYFPWIIVSSESLPFWIDLLNCRELTNTHVFNTMDNRFMCGVLNLTAACAVMRFPHLQAVLPVITDQILSHILGDEAFRGTLVELLNHILQGKLDSCAYHPPITFPLHIKGSQGREWLRILYTDIAEVDTRVALNGESIASNRLLGLLSGRDGPSGERTNAEGDRILRRTTASSIPPILVYADVKTRSPSPTGKKVGAESAEESTPGSEPGIPGPERNGPHFERRLDVEELEKLCWKPCAKSDWAPNLVLRHARVNLTEPVAAHFRFADLRRSDESCYSIPPKPLGNRFDNTLTIWVSRELAYEHAQSLVRILGDRARTAPCSRERSG